MKQITFKTSEHERWYKWYEYLSHRHFRKQPRPFKHLCKPFSLQQFADLPVEVMKEMWKEKTQKLHKT